MATCQQWQDHPKDPLKKKIRVNKTEMSILIGMAGRRGGGGGGGRVKAQFPCVFARDLETPWYIGECRATSCLSCCSTLSKQFPRFHSNYTVTVVFQGQDMHAFFICHHEQARNVRKSFRRYRSSWLKKYIWVARGIELYPQNGGQAAVVDAWAVHGIWWIVQLVYCGYRRSVSHHCQQYHFVVFYNYKKVRRFAKIATLEV